MGGIYNTMVSRDAKVRHAVSVKIDLSVDYTTENIVLLYDPDRRLVIDDITLVYVTEAPAAASTVNVGTSSDANAVVSAHTTKASGSIHDTESLTLASTLKVPGRQETLGKPVLAKATPLLWDSTASGGAGEVYAIVSYWPMDQEGKLH